MSTIKDDLDALTRWFAMTDPGHLIKPRVQRIVVKLRDATRLRPRDEWHEDIGVVLWWKLPIDEPPYCGTPLDDDFPEYVTHWTPLLEPEVPTS